MKIAIVGAGGQGKVVADLIRAVGCAEVLGFFDDRWEAQQRCCGWAVLGPVREVLEQWRTLGADQVVVALGDNRRRQQIFSQLKQVGVPLATLVHPRATLCGTAAVGPGTVVCAHAFVGPDSVVGENTIINTAASVDHDCRIGSHAHLCPGVTLAGGVWVGEGTLIGTGANLIPGVRVGEYSVIGAGSTVIKDLPDRVTAVGVPARIIHEV